jgi:uncharacterized protein YndB with AHSA1/START domain
MTIESTTKESSMANYTGTVSALHPPGEVWRYLADLRSVAQWDPSVAAARLVDGKPGTVGSRFEVDVTFLGRTVTLPYTTVEAEPPHHVVFSAETDLVAIRDEARIGPILDGSTVTWDADLQLRGPWRVFDLPLRAAFGRLGDSAERGLRERLNEPALTDSGERVRA